MKDIAIFIALTMAIPAHFDAAAKDTQAVTIPVEQYLRELSHFGQTPAACPPQTDSLPDAYPQRYIPLPRISCQKSFDTNSFCFDLKQKLEQTNLCVYDSCWYPNRSALWETTHSPQKVAQLKTAAFRAAKKTFDRLRSDDHLQAMCCGSNIACINRFASVTLKVLKGLPTDDQTAFYRSKNKAVQAFVWVRPFKFASRGAFYAAVA